MERRGFLKTLFGGAALAVLPPIIVERLAKTPVPATPPPIPANEILGTPVIPPPPPVGKGTVLLLYRDGKQIPELSQLVGSSIEFSINLHAPVRGVPKVRWSKYGWYEDFNAPMDYIQEPKSWDVNVYRIQWFVDPRSCWDDQLHMIAIQGEDTLKGDVYISSYDITAPMDEEVYGDATLKGTGELIFEA